MDNSETIFAENIESIGFETDPLCSQLNWLSSIIQTSLRASSPQFLDQVNLTSQAAWQVFSSIVTSLAHWNWNRELCVTDRRTI